MLTQLEYVTIQLKNVPCVVNVTYLNIGKVGWDEDRAAVQAWEDSHVKVSCLFFFPPRCSQLNLQLSLCAAAVLFPGRR